MTSRATKRRRSGRKPEDKPTNDGTPAAGSFCPSCGAQTQLAARFCHACGVSLEALKTSAGWDFKMLGLVVLAAIAIVSVVFATAVIVTEKETSLPPSRTTAGTGMGSSPSFDPSTMTPREAADHVFNRVMLANEQGKAVEVLQFAPMAVQAYESLAALDADGHYHLGMLQFVTGDFDKAREQIAKIKELVPNHLLALTLEHAIAEQIADEEAEARALAAFAAAYESEMATGRLEYASHTTTIEQLRAKAEASTSTSK